MNNEPVAIRYDFDGYGYQYMDSGSGSDWQTRVKGEPLYTHPVNPYQSITDTKIEPTVVSYTHPVKELTDEEIMEVAVKAWGSGHEIFWFDDDGINLFARAILKKAQEK